MCINQRQASGQRPAAHHELAFAALADVERRGVDDDQQLGTGLPGQPGGLVKPGVFADQQADIDGLAAFAIFCIDLENASALPRCEVAALIKYLVVGQLAFGVSVQHTALLQHPRGIVALLHRHAFGAHAAQGFVSGPGVAARWRSHHHRQAF